MMNVTALLTCFNRKDLTLECLRRLYAMEVPDGFRLRTILVDDGSTDGTGAAVADAFEEVEVIRGDGSLFWCGGMRKAWEAADRSSPDYILLINDDTMLGEEALTTLLELVPTPDTRVIGVGVFADPDTGVLTYGGRLRNRARGRLLSMVARVFVTHLTGILCSSLR